MDLNTLGPLTQFDTFDDDVSKESNDLTVDAGLSSEGGPFLSSVSQPEISGGLSVEPPTPLYLDQPTETVNVKRKGGWTKGKKRKKVLKDSNAPKQPLSGYLRFLTERRDQVRQEKPHLSFAEMSKQLGAEWSNLRQEEKQRYLDEAERDKEKYMRDLEAYQKTESYQTFKKQFDSRVKEDADSGDVQQVQVSPAAGVAAEEEESGSFDIPIFTEEFLDHNKARDAELRELRKQTTELEEQNAILSKHTDNMRQAVERLEEESIQQRQANQALTSDLEALRSCLTSSFSAVPLPGTGELPTLDTIDTYMAKLHSLILDSPQDNEQLIATVRDIVGRLNIESHRENTHLTRGKTRQKFLASE